MGDMAIMKPGGTYYLRKDRIVDLGRGRVQRMQVDSLADQDMLSISYDIDPTISKVKNEHMQLAEYMKDQYLTIDIFDADSQFLFAQAKLPMFELLRQQRAQVVLAKEVEACAPDSAEFRASIQIIMSNQGKKDKE